MHMTDLIAFGLVSFSAVFFVVDPLVVVPAYVAMTARHTPAQKRSIALRASVASCVTLLGFALAGKIIFRLFGISLGGFKIAGGVLLFLVSLDMMQARQSRTKSTPEEEQEGIAREDVAIIPLAIPLLSGPGAIATVMVLMSRHHSSLFAIPVFVSILLTGLLTWVILRGATWMQARISHTFLNVTSRLMGLILASVAVEFLVAGIKDLLPSLSAAAG